MRSRFLIPAVALLAMLAAAIPAFAQEEADDDAPPPSHSVELRVWQSVSDPLDGLWVSARADEDASWTTTALNIAMREGGGWRVANLTVGARDGELDVRVWQDPSDLRELWLSARPAGGSWDEYGTKRLDLDERSRSGRYRYDDVAVALEWPDAEPAEPGESREALCIPEGLEKERLFTRVWRSVATPHRYWISARPDADARWSTREVSLAESGVDGWNAGGLTFDAGDADFELRLWEGEGALYLSARVAGTTWDEDGTRRLNLTRTSASGRYTYANRTVRLTLPEAEPPDPGRAVRDWDCAGTGTGGGGGGTGGGETEAENNAPTADAGPDQTANVGDTVTLDGSGSADMDGDDMTYAWSQTNGGTYTGTVALTDDDTATPTFDVQAALGGQTVGFMLTVTDEGGMTDTDTVMIAVNQQQQGGGGAPPPISLPGTQLPQNTRPTLSLTSSPAAPVPPAKAARGQKFTITATASDDPGDSLTYTWTATPSGTLTGTADTERTLTIPSTATDSDTYTVSVEVSDGSLSVAKEISYPATSGNNAPTIGSFTAPPTNITTGEALTLTVAASDPDGDTLTASSYTWKATLSGTDVTSTVLSGTTGTTQTLTIPTNAALNAAYVVSVTVSDGNGGSATTSDTWTVNNRPPTIELGANPTVVTPGQTFTLKAANDPDGDTVSYEWTVTKSPSGTPPSGAPDASDPDSNRRFTIPAGASKTHYYDVSVTVSDEDGNGNKKGGSATDSIRYTVNNLRPTASVSAGMWATVGGTVTLDGSGSTDGTDGTISSYSWGVSGTPTATLSACTPVASTCRILNIPDTATVVIGNTPATKYTVELTVTDDDGATHTARETVTVNNRPPTVTLTPAPPTNITTGQQFPLTATASDPDSDTLTASSYTWKATLGGTDVTSTVLKPATTPTPTTRVLEIPKGAALNAAYVVSFTVSDGKGGSTTASRTWTVNNRPPTADASAYVGNEKRTPIYQSETVTLDGITSKDDDTGDSISSYVWEHIPGSGLYGCPPPKPVLNCLTAASKATSSFTSPNLYGLSSTKQSSKVRFKLTVTDTKGAKDTFDLDITVTNAPPTPPTLEYKVGENWTTTLPSNVQGGTSHELRATSTDPDGNDSSVTYGWSVSGADGNNANSPAATVSSSGKVTIPRGAFVDDEYTVTATVTDEDAGTNSSSVTLTVNQLADNNPPTAKAKVSADSGAPGDTIYLYDEISDDDPEDATLWCNWTKSGGTYGGDINFTFGSNIEYTEGSCADGVRFTIPNNAVELQTIKVKLTVKDGAHGVATSEREVTVKQ